MTGDCKWRGKRLGIVVALCIGKLRAVGGAGGIAGGDEKVHEDWL
jgi:hypothetical protein